MHLTNENIILLAFISVWILYKVYKKRQALKIIPDLLNDKALFVDVRTPEEYRQKSSQITRNIPLNIFESEAKKLPKNQKIVLCCQSGARSGMAAQMAKKLGFKQVINIGSYRNLEGF